MHKELAKVKSADLMIEDHGILTLFVFLDFGGAGQGFGGYALDNWSEEKNRRVGTAAGLDYVMQILKIFGVPKLENIAGRPVYALYKDENFTHNIVGLETPPFDGGKRFLIDDWRKEWGYTDA